MCSSLCPVVQVPLATINMHLGGTDCRPLSPAVNEQDVNSSSRKQRCDQQASTSSTGSAAPPTQKPKLLQHVEQKADVQVTEHNEKAALSSTNQPAATFGFEDIPHSLQLQVTPLVQGSSACAGPMSSEPQVHSSDVSTAAILPEPEMQIQHVPVPHSELLGEYVIASFVSAAEEAALISFVDTTSPPWKDTSFNGRHRYPSCFACLQPSQTLLLSLLSSLT